MIAVKNWIDIRDIHGSQLSKLSCLVEELLKATPGDKMMTYASGSLDFPIDLPMAHSHSGDIF